MSIELPFGRFLPMVLFAVALALGCSSDPRDREMTSIAVIDEAHAVFREEYVAAWREGHVASDSVLADPDARRRHVETLGSRLRLQASLERERLGSIDSRPLRSYALERHQAFLDAVSDVNNEPKKIAAERARDPKVREAEDWLSANAERDWDKSHPNHMKAQMYRLLLLDYEMRWGLDYIHSDRGWEELFTALDAK